MKSQLIPLVAAILCSLCFCEGLAQTRNEETINSGWLFHKGELPLSEATSPRSSEWTIVNLPHTWNDKDVLPEAKRGYYRGSGWYRKIIDNFKKDGQLRYFIYFEGANQETDLYVNKQKAGNHKGGYTAFCFEISDQLTNGRNEILIKVDNKHNANIPPLSADFTFFGGIYRDVKLITTSSVHLGLDEFASSGIFIETPFVNEQQGNVKINYSIANKSNKPQKVAITSSIRDQNNQQVALLKKTITVKAGEKNGTSVVSSPIANIRLWSPDDPYLYYVETTLSVNGKTIDEVVSPLGFRWYKFDADNGFYLNGKQVKLKGANRHQDLSGIGNALLDETHRSDLQLLKDMGGNFIRLAHYPQDPAILEHANKLGIMVWEEIPLVNEISLNEEHHSVSEHMLREMIRQHYNHPSVIMWGYMNEIYWKHRFIDSTKVDEHTAETIKLAKRLEAIARKEDPTRYTGMALHNYPLYEETGLGDIPMVVGWNLYHGWYYDNFDDFGKFMDEQHKLHPKRIHLISEYGAGSDPRIHTSAPVRFDFSMELHKAYSENFLRQINERKFIAGSTYWNLIDFSSELRVDATPRINNKGLATTDRTPKDPYYLFQAAFSDRPVLKIAETNYLNRSVSLGASDTAAIETIDVYTNSAEAELFVDGRPLGTQKVSNYKASWKVSLGKTKSYQLTAKAKHDDTLLEDHLKLNIKIIPFLLNEIKNLDLAINTGSHFSFFDPNSGVTWLPDQPYQKGSWGYISRVDPPEVEKMASLEDIYSTDSDPLYQSMRIGMAAYQFDVTDGWYEVELLCVEPLPKTRRFADSPEPPPHPGGLRLFSADVNGKQLLKNIDLIKELGYNNPMRKKITVKAENRKGLTINFDSKKAIVSGIVIRRLN